MKKLKIKAIYPSSKWPSQELNPHPFGCENAALNIQIQISLMVLWALSSTMLELARTELQESIVKSFGNFVSQLLNPAIIKNQIV